MTSEQQTGNLSEGYVMHALGARRANAGRNGEDDTGSYLVRFGDPEHPTWMRVWPEGGSMALASDWGQLEIEGISQVGLRRGQLWLLSLHHQEHIEVEVSPTGSWSARRELQMGQQPQASVGPPSVGEESRGPNGANSER